MLSIAPEIHPKKLRLELLASIPPKPARASIRALAEDFGVCRSKIVELADDAMRVHHIRLIINQAKDAISIAAESWPKARDIAEEYIDGLL